MVMVRGSGSLARRREPKHDGNGKYEKICKIGIQPFNKEKQKNKGDERRRDHKIKKEINRASEELQNTLPRIHDHEE